VNEYQTRLDYCNTALFGCKTSVIRRLQSIYRTPQHSAPIYLQEICNSVSTDVHRLRLRSTDHGDLVMPHPNTDRFGRRGFSVSGLNQWNKLPPDIRKVSDKPEQFARALKTFFYFQTALTSTSEDNIKRRAIAKTSTSTSTKSARLQLFLAVLWV